MGLTMESAAESISERLMMTPEEVYEIVRSI